MTKLGLQETFRFAGRQDDLVPFYRSANLMAHAAERESFGLAIVEAMAYGIPVVASAAAGPMETIVSGKTGCLAALKDEAEFVEAILRYIDDPQFLAPHGAQAQERSVRLYNVTRQGGVELAKQIARFL